MRFAALAASLVGSVVFAVLIPYNVVFIALFALCAILSAIGIWDLLQSKHSVRRNYPILANIRFMLEKVRPEIRQYFLESETDGTPFNRSKRAVAYQRAKGALDKRPFGTQQDIYGNNFEWINHSRRGRLPQALLVVAVQHFRHELRRAERKRHSRPQSRSQGRRLCA